MSKVFREDPARRQRMVKDVARFEGQSYLHVSMWLWIKLQNLERNVMVSVKTSVVKYEYISREKQVLIWVDGWKRR